MFEWLRFKSYRLYALRLEDNYYYVGLTGRKDVAVRYQEHFAGIGAAWTRLHKPVEIVEVQELGWGPKFLAEHLENKLTRAYIKRYGIQWVRGGSYCMVDLRTVRRKLYQ